jgi:transposase
LISSRQHSKPDHTEPRVAEKKEKKKDYCVRERSFGWFERFLRTLFMQGARVILLRPANWARHSFGPWLTAAAKRLHHNVLATALANKLARIAWTVLAQRRNYETRVVVA